ncbi:MAG TPA: hypothetical protein VN908_07875 [Gemmatimonadales bacterium]|nr:hypothetical protein [Gemmatimonadales bacterium]
MFARRSLMVLALALAIVRCADQPTAVRQPLTPRFVRWAGNATPQFTATRVLPSGDANKIFQTPPISLDQYSVSFWAVRGEARSVQINYRDVGGGTTHPFLLLTTTDPALVPGLGELAPGDSVLVTVSVDTIHLGVSLEPTGLQFGAPAQMQIWYGGAGGDLNGDGLVDSTDAYVEKQLLGLWYREASVNPWTPVPATQSLVDKSFTSALPHFSEYELLSLLDWVVSW